MSCLCALFLLQGTNALTRYLRGPTLLRHLVLNKCSLSDERVAHIIGTRPPLSFACGASFLRSPFHPSWRLNHLLLRFSLPPAAVGENAFLRHIRMCDNRAGDSFLRAAAQSLSSNRALRLLDMRGNKTLARVRKSSAWKKLLCNTGRLRSLDFSHCALGLPPVRNRGSLLGGAAGMVSSPFDCCAFARLVRGKSTLTHACTQH